MAITPAFPATLHEFVDGAFPPASEQNQQQSALLWLKERADLSLADASYASAWHAGFINTYPSHAAVAADGYNALVGGNTWLALKKFDERTWFMAWRLAAGAAGVPRGSVICTVPAAARPAADTFFLNHRVLHIDAATGNVRAGVQFQPGFSEAFAGFAGIAFPHAWGIYPDITSGITASVAGQASGSVLVGWEAPDYDGGTPITGYRVAIFTSADYNNPVQSTVVAAGLREYVYSGLAAATPYLAGVYAINSVGQSGRGTIIRFTTT